MASEGYTETAVSLATVSIDDPVVEDGAGERAVADGQEEEDVVDPWKVESKSAKGVDYDKLISKWHA